jgi:hypothetical protein
MLFGADIEGMPSFRALPGQGSLLTAAGGLNGFGREEVGIYPGPLNRHMLMSNPLEWSAEFFGVDFEM